MKKLLIIASSLFLMSCTVEEVDNITIIMPEPAPVETPSEPVPLAVPDWLQGTFVSPYLPDAAPMEAYPNDIYIDLTNAVQPAFSKDMIINYETMVSAELQPEYLSVEMPDMIITFYNTHSNTVQVVVEKDGVTYGQIPFIKQ